MTKNNSYHDIDSYEEMTEELLMKNKAELHSEYASYKVYRPLVDFVVAFIMLVSFPPLIYWWSKEQLYPTTWNIFHASTLFVVISTHIFCMFKTSDGIYWGKKKKYSWSRK